MRLFNFFLGGAVAALLMTSCNKDTRIADNADLGVNFRVTSGALTKATPTTVANLGSFKVTAIGNNASYFTDLNVAVTSAGVCTPEKTYYWPGYQLDFFAYANPSSGVASITNAANGVAGVTPVAAAADQQDFVVAYSTGTKADNMASGVALNFRHALSQIKVKATNKSTAGLKINVKGVKVANVKASGDFSYPATVTADHNAATLDFALWNSSSAAKTAYTIGGASETAVALSATAADIMFSGASWMLIPQQLVAWDLNADKANAGANAFIGVYLQILDAGDNQLYPATAGEYAYANVPIDTKWEPGKCYTYTLNFLDESNGGGAGVDDAGNPVLGSPINFTLTVDDWDRPNVQDINVGATDNNTAKDCTFGGLQISKGPLYYDGSEYKIADSWQMNSYGTAYGKTEGSTYFSFIEMGQLFEKVDFSSSDGNIENVLNPLDGWRLPTLHEWEKLTTTDASARPGSTVNGTANAHWAFIQLTGVTFADDATPHGMLVFPDGKTITGKTLDKVDIFYEYDDETDEDKFYCTTGVTLAELNAYLEQGCLFLPYAGYWNDGSDWNNGVCNYWSSTECDAYFAFSPFFDNGGVNASDYNNKSNNYFSVRLVRE